MILIERTIMIWFRRTICKVIGLGERYDFGLGERYVELWFDLGGTYVKLWFGLGERL